MRDARFLGLSADGSALIVEHDGEHLRLPVDDDVRAALRGQVQMPMPLETRVSPRELQGRIRRGESAAQIAAASGVAVELIARFEGPVLDERRWHAQQAQRTVVDGTPLAARLASAVAPGTDEIDAVWDSWLGDDGVWRVCAALPDGREAQWSWDPRTRRLRGRDDLARLALSGDIAANDLEAVLRPIAAAREARRLADVTPLHAAIEPADEAPPLPIADPADAAADDDEDGDTAAAPIVTAGAAEPDAAPEPDAVEPEPDDAAADARALPPDAAPGREPRTGSSRRRAAVPSWDEIVFGASRRPSAADDDAR